MAWQTAPTTIWDQALQGTPEGEPQQAIHSEKRASLAVFQLNDNQQVYLDLNEETHLELTYEDIPATLAAHGVPEDGWMSFEDFSNQTHYGKVWVED